MKKIVLLLILALGALLAVEFDDIRRYLKMATM